MSKRALLLSVIMIGGVICQGCIVQSFQRFYISDDIVRLDGLEGEWMLTHPTNESSLAKSPWVIVHESPPYICYVCDEENREGSLLLTPFKLQDTLLCDVSGWMVRGNRYCCYHWRGMHSVGLLETNAEEILFIPLNWEWLCQSAEGVDMTVSNATGLAYITRDESDDYFKWLFVNSSEAWRTFLLKNVGNTNAFDKSKRWVLRRRVASTNDVHRSEEE